MVEQTRDNHYVPQAYLRRWADENSLWCYRLLVTDDRVKHWRSYSIRSVGVLEHLYTVRMAGAETDQFEKWIEREFETPGQRVVEKVVSGERLLADDWRSLIKYAAAQDVRTPARFMEYMRRWHQTMPEFMETTLQRTIDEAEALVARKGYLPRQRQRYKPPVEFPFKVELVRDPQTGGGLVGVRTVLGRRMWLSTMRLALSKTVQALFKHRWSIALAPAGTSWITSDDPLIRLNYKNEREYDFGGGWGSPGSEIMLPLSPTHMLYTQIGKRLPPKMDLNAQLALRLQKLTAEHAHRWIYATSPMKEVLEWRVRSVNAAQYHDEKKQWSQWHKDQSAAEAELDVPTQFI